jgi:hypothetical protein
MSTVGYFYRQIVALCNTYNYILVVSRYWNGEYLVRVKTTVPYSNSFNERFFDEDGYATWEYQTVQGIDLIDEIEEAYDLMVVDFISIN